MINVDLYIGPDEIYTFNTETVAALLKDHSSAAIVVGSDEFEAEYQRLWDTQMVEQVSIVTGKSRRVTLKELKGVSLSPNSH